MWIRGKSSDCYLMIFYYSFYTHRQPECADKPVFSQIQHITCTNYIQFLLSDVLHCTNMNNDFYCLEEIAYCYNRLIDLHQCITFRLIKLMPLFAFAFDEFWKSKFANVDQLCHITNQQSSDKNMLMVWSINKESDDAL